VATVPEAGALLAALEAARVEPAALELLDSPSARGAEARGAEIPWRAKGAEGSWTVALLFEGSLAQVEALVGSAAALVPEHKPVVLEGGLSESFWQGVSELSAAGGSALTADGRARLFIRASVLPTDVPGLVQRWHAGRFDPSLGLQIHAHAASGHVNLKLTGSHVPILAEAWERACEDLRERDGTAHLVDAPPVLRSQLPLWFCASGPLPLMKALKDAFDPGGNLSPGRLPFDA
jgi:FAD/FMN-containing dehydrogenase